MAGRHGRRGRPGGTWAAPAGGSMWAMLLPLHLFLASVLLSACSGIECPLDSLVYTQYQLMKAGGEADTLRDTLTITTTQGNGNDTVVLNRMVNATEFTLPISYTNDSDVFHFHVTDTLGVTTSDQVVVSKTNRPHFESVNCAPAYFHTITAVTWTGNAIDSIVITNAEVTYDIYTKHFSVYFKHRD